MQTCTKCGKTKPLECCVKGKNLCKECAKEYSRKYREQNRERLAEHNRKYYEQNRERLVELSRKYYEQNKEKVKEYNRKWSEQQRINLTDWYIKKQLKGRGIEPTPELIGLERAIVAAKRAIKNNDGGTV